MTAPEFLLRLAGFWWPCVAVLLIWVAITGWGSVAVLAIGPRRAPGVGTRGAWGLALTCTVGGLLNLFGGISLITVRAYLGVGVVAAIVTVGRGFAARADRRPADAIRIVAGVVVAGLVILAIVGGAANRFNPHDDFHAYLDFPVKMLEAGRIGNDPFSERRMLEYGGQSFLHALTLGLVDLSQVHIFEFGVAPLILMAQLAARGRAVVGLAMGVFVLTTPMPLENLTSVASGLVLFYALLESLAETDGWLQEPGASGRARIVTLTLLIAGLIALKNSHIPGLGLILAGAYLAADRRPVAVRAREAAWIAIGAAVLLLPWMISMRESSGTLLYPLLGQGYSGSVYSRFIAVTCGSWTRGEFVREFNVLLKTPEVLAGATMALLTMWFARTAGMRVAAWCSLGAYAAALVVDVANGGMGPRYVWAFTFACLLFTLMEAMTALPRVSAAHSRRGIAIPAVAALVIVGALIVIHARTDAAAGVFLVQNGYETLRDRSSAGANLYQDAQRLRGLQTFVPAGQPILARLSHPFQLNFARNEVNIVDWPGGASLPPGMPIEASAEDLAAYLRSHGRRYVMYSYGDEAGYSYAGFRHRIRPGDGYIARARVTTELTFAFQDRLEELGQRYTHLADDGDVFVLDLNSPRR